MKEPLRFLAATPPKAADAPSELTLDRYVSDELSSDERARVEAWLLAHPEMKAAVETRRRFPAGLDSERVFARIEAGVERAARASEPRREPWWRRLLSPAFLGTAVLAAAAVLIVARPWSGAPTNGDGPDELRVKGGFGFLVHRKTEAGSEALVSGDEAREGDELRFEIDLPETREVMIIDQDPSGALSQAWPLTGLARSEAVEPSPRELPGAVALDDALGDEWLHAVACPAPFAPTDIVAKGPGVLKAPEGCNVVGIRLKKVR